MSWLVRYHLLLSSTAFKRDLADPKTIEDFVAAGAKPGAAAPAAGPDGCRHPCRRARRLERMEADAAADFVRSRRGAASARAQAARPHGDRRGAPAASLAQRLAGRRARSRRMRAVCPTATGWPSRPPGSWPTRGRLRLPKRTSGRQSQTSSSKTIRKVARPVSASSLPTAKALFYRICAGLAAAGANIIDARIHTTRDGMALDNLLVLDGRGHAYSDRRLARAPCQIGRSGTSQPGTAATAGRGSATPEFRVRGRAFGRDSRPRLDPDHGRRSQCARPAGTACRSRGCDPRLGHTVHSAHIATYGERAVDVFYLTRADGKKLDRRGCRASCGLRCSTRRASRAKQRPHKKKAPPQ